MARHREFDETKALSAAMKAFWAKGYDGTSLQDLENAMDLTRTSIYNAFGNKRDLFEKAVNYYHRTELSRLAMLLAQGETVRDGVRKLLMGAIDLHFRDDTPGGCLVVLSLLEREQHTEQSIRFLEKILQDTLNVLKKRISEAQGSSELSRQIGATALATSIVTTMAGIMVMGKAGASKPAMKKVVDTTCHMLEGLEPAENA